MPSEAMPVIAVFGSTVEETVRSARLVGRQIAQQRCVTLTGASQPPSNDHAPDAVKQAAVAGASETVQRPHRGPWIGVARSANRKSPQQDLDAPWIVCWPGYQHKRNLVEAYLCDVAIAFPGGDGTISEVTFCLALGRPVVLIQEDPPASDPTGAATQLRLQRAFSDSRESAFERTTRTLRDLAERARAKMRDDEVESPFDPEIHRLLDELEGVTPTVQRLPLPTTESEAVTVVKEALMLLKQPRSDETFPDWLEDAETARMYRDWLDTVSARARKDVPQVH